MSIAFCFDCDGVLGKLNEEHKRKAIDGVENTLKLLDKKNIQYMIISNTSQPAEDKFSEYF